MRRNRAFGTLAPALLGVCAVAGACAPAQEPEEAPAVAAAAPVSFASLEHRGEVLFTTETFDGNGRVCSTCHEPDLFGTITPEFVQEQYALDPNGPLFRSIDSDNGKGDSYSRLLEHATVRVPVETPFDEAVGRAIRRCDAPGETTVVLHRGNPTMFNAALEEMLMHDGREGGDLEAQARNAILTHNEPGRDAAPEELTAIAAFQESLFSHAAVKAFLDRGAELRLPDGNTPAEVRGRAFFEPNRQCGICHSGPMLNRTSEFHTDVVGARFESSSVGSEPDNPNEKFEWCFVDPATNEISPPTGLPEPLPDYAANGRVFKRPVADPGIALIRDPTTDVTVSLPDGGEATLTSAMVSVIVGLPLFKIPTLWGVPESAPYFHDNSARTLEDVLVQYNFMFAEFTEFAETVGCNPAPGDCLSEQDRRDIVEYLQLLSFEGGGIRPVIAQ
jgi:cytochrome c peroxidase